MDKYNILLISTPIKRIINDNNFNNITCFVLFAKVSSSVDMMYYNINAINFDKLKPKYDINKTNR